MPDWSVTEEGLSTTVPGRTELQEQLRAEQETNLLLQESIADLQLSLEDRGWRKLSADVADEFTPEGRRRLAEVCRIMVVANPLMKRAANLRIGYIWGQGVEVRARAGEDAKQNVDEVVQAFWKTNAKSLTGSQAQEELERAEITDGNVILALFTSPLTGVVNVRSTPIGEIADIITNPQDRDEPWFYVREYTETTIENGYNGPRTRNQTKKVIHPALGYRPGARITTLNGAPIRWDAPMLHIPVNRLDGWKWGVPDAYASVAWARMYRDFLVDWAGLTKSLSKFAWKATNDNRGRAAKAAAAITANATLPGEAGQAAVMGAGSNFEAVSKSGATIDSNSGKPLAGMAAAGMGVPLTMLLADPGITGARATAETLDLPLILEMGMRRLLWQDAYERILEHVIDNAVTTPQGSLSGTVSYDAWGQKVVTLAGDVEPTVEFDWPPIVDIDPVELIKAIVAADGTDKMPPLTTVRLLLKALGVKDIEELIKTVTDEQGNFKNPNASAAQTAVDAHRKGQDPADVTR